VARAWRLAVGPASTRTLGLAKHTVQCSRRISACRRGLNSHKAAAPRKRPTPPPGTVGPCREIGRRKDRRLAVGTTLPQVTKAMTGNRRATSEHRAAWEAIVFSRFVGSHPAPARLRTVKGRSGSNARRCHRRQRRAGRRHGGRQQKLRSPRRSSLWYAGRGLTPRSSGAPTAGHKARSGGTLYIFASPSLASCRRRPLNSNVRPHQNTLLHHATD